MHMVDGLGEQGTFKITISGNGSGDNIYKFCGDNFLDRFDAESWMNPAQIAMTYLFLFLCITIATVVCTIAWTRDIKPNARRALGGGFVSLCEGDLGTATTCRFTSSFLSPS